MASGLFLLALATLGTGTASGAERPEDGPPPLKVRRYAGRLVKKYDRNGDGKLQQAEWRRMQGDPASVDSDGDGLITAAELTRRVVGYGRTRRIRPLRRLYWNQAVIEPLLRPTTESAAVDGPVLPPADSPTAALPPVDDEQARRRPFVVRPSRIPKGLPEWFDARDLDGDGQVSMAEYAPRMTHAVLQRFTFFDVDGDGVITAAECRGAAQTADRQTAP